MTVDFPEFLNWIGAEWKWTARLIAARGNVGGWSIDSRSVQPGDVFFALRGPNHDAHDYVEDVVKRSAFAVIDREVPRADPSRMIRVDDSLHALQRLARQARRTWGGQIVAVTGSAGKTTTKDVIAHFLSTRIPVGKTVGNLNNHIGLPLSILRLPDSCRVAVLEMGMNHAGEIRDLATIAEPDVAVVTNVGYAHIEFFGSIEGIALAKRELVESLSRSGVAVLNADDERVAAFARIHRGRTVTYGFTEGAEFRGTNLEGDRFKCNGVIFETPLAGRHGALNVLAGIATASLYGISFLDLPEVARTIPVGKMRGERIERNGLIIFNDAYNANPEAMRAMLDVLVSTPARRHVAVLGEMLELGAQSETLHRAVGEYAAGKKIDLLIGVRGAAHDIVDEATLRGMPSGATLFFEDPSKAGVALRSLLQPGDAILFKGSRGVAVEKAIDALLEANG